MDKGDPVTVVMDTNGRFPWQRGCEFDAIYRYGPQGPGDVFTLEVVVPEPGEEPSDDVLNAKDAKRKWRRRKSRHDKYHGRTVSLNGNSSAFVGIYEKQGDADE